MNLDTSEWELTVTASFFFSIINRRRFLGNIIVWSQEITLVHHVEYLYHLCVDMRFSVLSALKILI